MFGTISITVLSFAIGLWVGTFVAHARCHQKIKLLAEMVELTKKDKVG